MIRCLGEALVDLICEHPVASLTEADSFSPHFGGALANVAVAAARAGADVECNQTTAQSFASSLCVRDRHPASLANPPTMRRPAVGTAGRITSRVQAKHP